VLYTVKMYYCTFFFLQSTDVNVNTSLKEWFFLFYDLLSLVPLNLIYFFITTLFTCVLSKKVK
jgi:hypothetical protein